jgi:opine dehydrogenase
VESRYITEDVPVGCRVYYELAKKYGIKVPIIKSMISIASTVNNINYFEKGFSLKDLGIENMSHTELIKYLKEG